MTIQRAIELLTTMKEKHGDVEVVFDCQYCGKSTRPTVIRVIVAVGLAKADPNLVKE